MKYLFFVAMGLFYCFHIHGQTLVKGSVEERQGIPLQSCSIWFLQADTLAGGTVTDQDGKFELKGLPAGEYVCRVSMIGFKIAEQLFSLTGKTELPTFALEEDLTQLNEVTVSGDRRDLVVTNAGSTTFYLSEQAKKANNAYDALVEIPLLNVNPVERKITLNTGESPLILIDGVKRTGYIDVLNPEQIESVEVVEVPSARYLGDESVTCILNIRLKRTRAALYVNGNGYAQHSLASKYGVAAFNFEVGNNRASLYTNLQYFYFDDDKSHTYSETQSGDLLQQYSNTQTYDTDMFYANVGGDYVFSDKDYVSFSASYIGQPTDIANDREGTVGYVSDEYYTEAYSHQQNDQTYQSANANLYYKHDFSNVQTLEVTGNYSYSNSDSSGERTDENGLYTNRRDLDFDSYRHLGKLDVDYANVFNGKYSLTAGSNTSYTTNYIDDRTDDLSAFRYNRWQEYLYVGFDNNRAGSKFKYTLSLGMDMMFSEADGVKNHYIDLLPAVGLSYRFSQIHTLTLNYNRFRYSPSLSMLNPRNTSTDSLYVQQGNPYLTPSFQDRVNLSYRLNYKKLYLEPYVRYTYSSDLILAVGTVEDNIYTNTYRNFLCAHFITAGGSINYNLPFGNLNLNGYYQRRFQKDMAFNGNSWNLIFSGNFFYKQVSLMLNAGYQNASYDRNSMSKGTPWSNATFTWNLPKGWQLRLMGQNFLWTGMRVKSWVREEDYRAYSASRMTDRTPQFLIGFSYSFKNKVENKGRQKKLFYNNDSELENIKVD